MLTSTLACAVVIDFVLRVLLLSFMEISYINYKLDSMSSEHL